MARSTSRLPTDPKPRRLTPEWAAIVAVVLIGLTQLGLTEHILNRQGVADARSETERQGFCAILETIPLGTASIDRARRDYDCGGPKPAPAAPSPLPSSPRPPAGHRHAPRPRPQPTTSLALPSPIPGPTVTVTRAPSRQRATHQPSHRHHPPRRPPTPSCTPIPFLNMCLPNVPPPMG